MCRWPQKPGWGASLAEKVVCKGIVHNGEGAWRELGLPLLVGLASWEEATLVLRLPRPSHYLTSDDRRTSVVLKWVQPHCLLFNSSRFLYVQVTQEGTQVTNEHAGAPRSPSLPWIKKTQEAEW